MGKNKSTWIKDGKIIPQKDIDHCFAWYIERLTHQVNR